MVPVQVQQEKIFQPGFLHDLRKLKRACDRPRSATAATLKIYLRLSLGLTQVRILQ